MKSKIKQFFNIFFIIAFVTYILSFFLCEVFATQKISLTIPIERHLIIINSFILCTLPFLFSVYFYNFCKNKDNKYIRHFIFVFFCFYYFFLFFLLAYLVVTLNFFDLDFFTQNFRDVFFTVASVFNTMSLFYVFVFAILFMLSFFFSIKLIKFKNKLSGRVLKYVIIFFILLTFFISAIQFFYRYEKSLFVDFLSSFLIKDDVVYKQYKKDYLSIVNRYLAFKLENFSMNSEFSYDMPDLYFIHLESVNGDLMNKSIISNFDNYSNDNGVVFNNFYSNSIQTLRAEESILCALPPSMSGYFHYQFNTKDLVCIPEILSKYGYKSFLFKSHSLEFAGAGKFLSNIGFNELHHKDIMKDGDVLYDWGFREDIFYKRAYEYLQKYNNQKKFVYIAVSSTNHYPFVVYDKHDDIPIKNASLITDRLMNTVYIQDQYLKNILEDLKNDKRKKYVFLFSDHSWPLNKHEKNFYNMSNGYRENFHIPFAFLVFGENGDSNFNIESSVYGQYNQIDFLKTMLDLLNIKTENKYLGNSFYCELIKDEKNCNVNNCSISVQPYSKKYITFFYQNKHYIYNIKNQSAEFFDLVGDVDEKNPTTISQLEFLNFYNECKKSIGY